MQIVDRCSLAVAGLVLIVALSGCVKSDQQVCAGKGYAAGTDAFSDCLSHQAEKHAALDQQNSQTGRTMQNTASMIRSAMGGTPGLSPN
jgi:hypothetical protein